MSVIKQPPQIIPFSENLDFQTRYTCDSCCPYILVPDDSFPPFGILTPSSEIGDTRVMYSDNTLYVSYTLSFNPYLDENTGLYFNYYDGETLILACGVYYLMIEIGGIWYYSELFQVFDVSAIISSVPAMIYDDFHLPLRVFTSLIKQYNNRCDDECNVTPITDRSSILPFLFEPGIVIQLDDIITTLIRCDGVEIDISSDIEYQIANSNPTVTSNVLVSSVAQLLQNKTNTFHQQNKVFQQIRVNDTGILEKIEFDYDYNSEAITLAVWLYSGKNPMLPGMILNAQNVVGGGAGVEIATVIVDYSPYNIAVNAGDYITIVIQRTDECYANIRTWNHSIYPYGEFGIICDFSAYESEIIKNLDEYADGGNIYGNFKVSGESDTLCHGTYVEAKDDIVIGFNNIYTATEAHGVHLTFDNIGSYAPGTSHIVFQVSKNAVFPLVTIDRNFVNHDVIPAFSLDINLNAGDTINVYLLITDAAGYFAACEMRINIPNSTGLLHGVNYIDESLCFNCWINKTITSGTGTNYLYQTGKQLSQPFECGVYYVKIEMSGLTWFTDRFLSINIWEIVGPDDETDLLTFEEDITHLVEFEEGGNIEI